MIEKLSPIPIGKAEDISNQRFGHLVALYRVKNHNNRPTWQCKCDCGNYFVTTSKALKNRSTLSCGCAKNENHIKDHTGEKYGKLTVLKKSPNRSSSGTILWECQCECGNIITIRASNLKTSKSCGKCFKGKDITGQTFGKLLAIKYHHTDKNKKSVWECKCECGTIVYVTIGDLISGKTKSCGCLKSRGEELISSLLLQNNIEFEKQKTFSSCRFPTTKALALFDFWVDNKYLIEFDGIQHFKAIGGWSDKTNLEKQKQYDDYKNQWCKNNNISLIRIPYTKLSELTIEDLKIETSNFII